MASAGLLQALKEELRFLTNQGYGRPFRSAWRSTLLLRDSPICLNFDSSGPLEPCGKCILLELVPEEQRGTPIPCHHIPLNPDGDDIAKLYRSGTQDQLDAAYRQWLRHMIEELERKEAAMKALATSTAISLKNILFLTDFSDASRTALVYALALAKHHGAKLYPAHVFSNFPPGPMEVATADFSERMRDATRTQLEELVKRTSTTFQPLVAEGMIEDAVQRWIAEHGIDLIVMGTHGRRGVQRFLLGSTAEAIFRTATCPVLTVGPNVMSKPYDESRVDKLLFATDLTPESEYALTYALGFARERKAHITLLHVVPEPARRTGDQTRLESVYANELKNLVPEDAGLWCEPEFRVEEGDPAERILNFAEREMPDFIVLGLPRKKDFSTHFQSGVTYKVVSSAPCPVLTVRDMLKK